MVHAFRGSKTVGFRAGRSRLLPLAARSALLSALLWPALALAQCPDGTVAVDPATGIVTVTFTDADNREHPTHTVTENPGKNFKATVESSVSFDSQAGLYTYSYTIQSDPSSVQSINIVYFDIDPHKAPVLSPEPSSGQWEFVSPPTADFKKFGWAYTMMADGKVNTATALSPGTTRRFSFQSPRGPGAVTLLLRGHVPVSELAEYPAEPSECINQLIDEQMLYPNGYVSIPTVGPVP